MYTINDYIKYLPLDIRTKFIQNVKNYSLNNSDAILNTNVGSFDRVIAGYFSWHDTDEGVNYWIKVQINCANGVYGDPRNELVKKYIPTHEF